VSTNDIANAITTITDVQANQLLVTIKRRDFFSDLITFTNLYGGKSVNVKDWMQERKLENGRLQWRINTAIGSFIWRIDVVLRLTLCSENDLNNAVAWVQLRTESKPYALILKRGTESIRDHIVASYIMLEQKMRMKEKRYFIGDGIALQDSNVMAVHYATSHR